jgi:PD-(D/E)XK nuclease superfamily
MPSVYRDVFRSLADRELLLPYLRHAVLSQNWPDEYTVKVDSSPYYGHGDGYFHPSTHAVTTNFNLAGARYLYYLFHPEYQDKLVFAQRDVQDEMTLAMGSALHAVVQTQFVQSGLLVPEDIEVEYVNEDHHVRGRIDFIINHPIGDRVVTEFKTLNSRAFPFQKQIKTEWDAQLSLALDWAGQPYGVLLVLESGHPYRMKEFKVPRNDALLSEIYSRFDLVRESLALDTPPPHCCALGSKEMDRCPARYVCWLANKVVRDG